MDTSDSNGQGNFRDSVATISHEGKRNWIYPQNLKAGYISFVVT